MRFLNFRDCTCEHTRFHHSQKKPRRCLHQDCNCIMYSPKLLSKKPNLIQFIRGLFS